VQGGIPVRTNIFVNCLTGVMYDGSTNLNYKCHADGVHDDSAIISAAITACLSNYVVYIPAGTYLVTNTISPLNYQASKSYYTLRGDGPGTELYWSTPNDGGLCIGLGTAYFDNISPAHVCSIYSGETMGSSNIAVVNTAGNANTIAVGMLLQIDQLNQDAAGGTNETSLVTIYGAEALGAGYDRPTNGSRCISQIVQVTGVSQATNITFQPPLMWNFNPAYSPQAAQMAPSAQYVGLENFKILLDTNNNKGYEMIQMSACCDSWITGVESSFAKRWHFYNINCLFCTFSGNYIHDSTGYTVGSGYGFESSYSTACICENNILSHLWSPLIFDGNTGCVVAYNYCPDNQVFSPANFQGPYIFTHEPHPIMNLFEGNVSPNISFDHIHGSGSDQTVFRNYFAETNPAIIQNIVAVNIDAWNQSNNIVGNVLGESSRSYIYSAPVVSGYANYNQNLCIFRLGFPIGGNNNFTGVPTFTPFYSNTNVYDLRVPSSTTISGNYDYATHSTIWVSQYTNLPASLCYSNTPDWWPAGYAWPPIGPDLTPMVSMIPAQGRFNAIGNTAQQLAPPSDLHIVKPTPDIHVKHVPGAGTI
jgi:hypothetical protein